MSGGRAFRRLLATGLLLLCAAIGTYAGLRAAYGNRPVYVHVRWAPKTDEGIRRELEERFSLTDGELRDSPTWGYVLTDVSRDNIRALVMDPAVEDTHQLHRSAYRPGYFAPKLPYSTSYPLIPSVMELLALILAALSLLALAAAAVESLAPAAARGPLAALRDVLLHPITAIRSAVTAILRWIESRIPVAEPESAALFRVVFGVALLAIVLQRPVDAAWAVDPANALSPVHRALLAMFIGQDGIVTALPAWIAIC